MKQYLHRFLLSAIVVCSIGNAWAQAPVISAVTASATSIAKHEKLELSLNMTAGYANPYDYDEIAVKGFFTSPSGRKDTVDGFFMQDYTLNTVTGSISAVGVGNFRIRFTPNEIGAWSYTVSCSNTIGSGSFAAQNFQCVAGANSGFVRRNSTNYLSFDNGTQYIPVGENMCWQSSNAYLNFSNWLNKLADNKGNFIRLWMPSWGLGLEWKNGYDNYAGLKKYKQSNAYYLDWLLEYCKSKGVYVMLCLNHHGQVSTTTDANWSDNPYNAANGGPCVNTWDFFTNSTAKNLLKNRLRYINARYGYSANIMSWELFNEVDWTNNFSTVKGDVTSWHNEMATYLKTKDVNKHLVTTSYARDGEDANTWNLPAIDFTQTHFYNGSANVETILTAAVKDYLTAYNKPTINGEFGLDVNGAALIAADANGVHLHNSIWATSFSGAMGSAMTWWWDNYVDPQNLYHHYKPLGEFISTIPLKEGNYKKINAGFTGGGNADVSLSPGAGWGAVTSSTFTITAAGESSPGSTQLGSFLYGNTFNTALRNPPAFSVNYPVAGQFKVSTANTTGTSPKINIYVDGVEVLNNAAVVNTTYSVNVPAGSHTIKVDNLGTDWITIAAYSFTNIGTPLNGYVLRAADSSKAAGWIHNKKYNHRYLKDNGAVPPAAVSGATLTLPGMRNGVYEIKFINCSNAAVSSTATANATGSNLSIALPNVNWDIAITASLASVTAIRELDAAKELRIYPNPVSRSGLFVEYELTRRSKVSIDVLDLSGRKLKTIFDGSQNPGKQLINENTLNNTTCGVYLVQLKINGSVHTERILVAR